MPATQTSLSIIWTVLAMPKRKSREYQNIKNLGGSAQKKLRISGTVRGDIHDKENAPLTPQQVIERRARTFASIIQPTWSVRWREKPLGYSQNVTNIVNNMGY
ncbi:hypothetical protein K466DRAFT_604085 [Polyporus arcularius HHB13444]|uniref:Uncharacterized protein n=1 Tax=Polyporus arcularius HHB13444 TaxID=1314778 RepID=A0A5C3NZG7_9APHY|nr:hypothetical protein K466DRAFT_604085 [Polyporus arcularius HHB13444]